jgi:hypothetical protein
MSHNVFNVQGVAGDVTGDITNTISEAAGLGQMLTNSSGQIGSGSGFYIAGDNYLFFTGANSYVGDGVTVSGDTISIKSGIFVIFCVPTFGSQSSTLGNTDMRAQFQDASGEALGNINIINRDSFNCTYNGSQICSAYVEGPRDVHLKVISVNGSVFPKNGTETSNSNFFLEIIRVK